MDVFNYKCEGQISIFDLLKPDYPDFHTMTEAEIVQYIGNALGLSFRYDDFLEQWEAKKGKAIFTVNLHRYLSSWHKGDEENGELFISCGYSVGTYGWGRPCDSMEEAITKFKEVMNREKR